MGFFQTVWTWLDHQLATYIGTTTTRVASILEPAIVTFATVYVMVWGYLQLTGRIEEPVVAGLKRIMTLAVVLGVALHLWLYNSIIVDTFYRAPAQLAAALTGARDPVKTIDAIWDQGAAVAGYLFSGSGLVVDLGNMIAALIVWVMVGMLCIYTMFLIALSSIALSVLLALGPLFFTALLFESTRKLFEAWMAQLTNYALITVLTVLVSTLLLQIVAAYAGQTMARGPAVTTVDTTDMVLISVLVFLVMRQVMPLAAGLANSVALSSFGAVSRFVIWGLRTGRIPV